MDEAGGTTTDAPGENGGEKRSSSIPAHVQSEHKDSSPSTPKPEIKFKDAVGRKFRFPFHRCQKWKDMENLIIAAFDNVDILGDHVRKGRYDLLDPEGRIILPVVWDDTIQPGWEITMYMWPIEDTAPRNSSPQKTPPPTRASPPPGSPPSPEASLPPGASPPPEASSPPATSPFSPNSGKHMGDEFDPFMFPLDVAPLSKKSKKGKDTSQITPWMLGNKRPKQALASAKQSRRDTYAFSSGLPMIEHGTGSIDLGGQQRISPPPPPSPKTTTAQPQGDVPQISTAEDDQNHAEHAPGPPASFHPASNRLMEDPNHQETNATISTEIGPQPQLPQTREDQTEAVDDEVEYTPVPLKDRRRVRTDATIGVMLPTDQLELSGIEIEDVEDSEHVNSNFKQKLSWKMQEAMATIRRKIIPGGNSSQATEEDSDLESYLTRRNRFSRLRNWLPPRLSIRFLGYHHVLICLTVVSILLISLLLAGCTSGSLVSGIYVMSLQYQHSSRMSSSGSLNSNVQSLVANASNNSHLEIRTGYFSICVTVSGASWLCKRSTSELSRHFDADQDPLNLLNTVKDFRDSVIFPGLLLIAFELSVPAVVFAALSTLGMATFPGWHEEFDAQSDSEIDVKPFPSRPVSSGCLALIAAAAVLSLLASLWQHTASVSVSSLIETTTYGYVKTEIGTSAMVLGWIGFFLFAVVSTGLLVMVLSIRTLDRLLDE